MTEGKGKKWAHGACRRGASSEPRYVTLTRVPLSRGSVEASPTPPVWRESRVARVMINPGGGRGGAKGRRGSRAGGAGSAGRLDQWDSPPDKRGVPC